MNSNMGQRAGASGKACDNSSDRGSTQSSDDRARNGERSKYRSGEDCESRQRAERTSDQASFFSTSKGVFFHRNILRFFCLQENRNIGGGEPEIPEMQKDIVCLRFRGRDAINRVFHSFSPNRENQGGSPLISSIPNRLGPCLPLLTHVFFGRSLELVLAVLATEIVRSEERR